MYEDSPDPSDLIKICFELGIDIVKEYNDIVNRDIYDEDYEDSDVDMDVVDEEDSYPHNVELSLNHSAQRENDKFYYDPNIPWVTPGFEDEGDLRGENATNVSKYFYYDDLPPVEEARPRRRGRGIGRNGAKDRAKDRRRREHAEHRADKRSDALRTKRLVTHTLSHDVDKLAKDNDIAHLPSITYGSDNTKTDLDFTSRIVSTKQLLRAFAGHVSLSPADILTVEKVDDAVIEFQTKLNCELIQHKGHYFILPQLTEDALIKYAKGVDAIMRARCRMVQPTPSISRDSGMGVIIYEPRSPSHSPPSGIG